MSSTIPASLTVMHESFAIRMKQACDSNSHVPPMNDGRLVWIKTKMAEENEDVSLQTVMRWYYGAAMPRQKKLICLANALGVTPSWLSLGRDDTSRVNTSTRRISTEGAINATIGHMQMAGLACAFPEQDDPRADLVHFYCIIGGRQHPIHVATAGLDKDESSVVFHVPTDHAKAIVVLVLPISLKSIEMWHVNAHLIDTYGERDSDAIVMSASFKSNILSFGDVKVPTIARFDKALMN